MYPQYLLIDRLRVHLCENCFFLSRQNKGGIPPLARTALLFRLAVHCKGKHRVPHKVAQMSFMVLIDGLPTRFHKHAAKKSIMQSDQAPAVAEMASQSRTQLLFTRAASY